MKSTDIEIADAYVRWRQAKDTPQEDELFEVFNDVCDIVALEPDRALRIILLILDHKDSNCALEILAAGPLEDLLSGHGLAMIGKIEDEARRNPKFAFLLGGVWPSDIDPSVWLKVEAIRNRKGWDGIPR